MEKHLHIIALNIPYPPNYGGVIDIYYMLTALHARGVRIILHCFEYERPRAAELEAVCEEVHYYRRRTGWLSNLSLLPYNVYSRKDPALVGRLLADDYPILFEGLHCCYYLGDERLHDRLKVYRECNIEQDYYRYLADACRDWKVRLFLRLEAWRFKRFQAKLHHADMLCCISQTDTEYLRRIFPKKLIFFVPACHANEAVRSTPGQSDFVLYHAKLSVYENEQVALFLVREVFSRLDCPCVLAGMNPSTALQAAVAEWAHIRLEANPSAERMDELIREAQLHLLVTFQPTGLKLKLLNSLFGGRHVVVNRLMLEGSGLESLCRVADSSQEMVEACRELLALPFDEETIRRREAFLVPDYTSAKQAAFLISQLYYE